jgi:hypothetical protein
MADDDAATPEEVHRALDAFKAALDVHLQAVEARTGENDPMVQAAYDRLAAAAESYDDMLFAGYEEVTPFGPIEGLDESDESDDDDEDDDVEWEPEES